MKSEHRALLAVALSAAFFVLWFYVFNPPKERADAPASSAGTVERSAPAQASMPQAASEQPPAPRAGEGRGAGEARDPQEKFPIKGWTLKNGDVEVDLTSDGAAVEGWRILKYRQAADPKSPPATLANEAPGLTRPLALSFEGADFPFPSRPRFELISADESKAAFRWRSADVEIVKAISLPKAGYLAEVSIEIKNLSARPLSGRALLAWSGLSLPPKKGGILGFLKQQSPDERAFIMLADGKVIREAPAKVSGRSERAGAILWAGLESRYFLSAVIPRLQGEGLVAVLSSEGIEGAPPGSQGLVSGAALPPFAASPGEAALQRFSVYAGPKEIGELKGAGVRLEDAIDYGWFTVIAVPILHLLKFFHGVTHNWGIAIIILTIFVKLLLHPINVRSLKSMKAMQDLQPRLKELRERFAADKQRLNQETMQLFRSNKVNPMGGCLPMLAQFPIYIALYKVLWNSIELYHAPFFAFYRDLSAPDPYLVTPILLGVFMVAQQRLMPSASADPAQQKMMMFMPIMFSAFMLFLPVGLVIYILINTAMSVAQQHMYNKGIHLVDLMRGKWRRAN